MTGAGLEKRLRCHLYLRHRHRRAGSGTSAATGGARCFRAPRLHTQSSPALHSGKGASPRKSCRDAATLSAFEGVGGFGATPKQLLHAQL